MKTLQQTLALIGILALSPAPSQAGNPLINTVHSADPSAHVWPGDERLWIYASHDQPGTNTHDTMISYHVFSSENLVDWIDYGVVMHQDNVDWAAGNMWAIDCVKKGDKWYLVYCAVAKDDGNFHTALAEATQAQGPFKDIGRIKGTAGGQDPALYVDDDGRAYLYWGGGNKIFAAELREDLRSIIPESKVELTQQLTWCYEGPWLHKNQGNYTLSYPGLLNKQWPERMYYAVGKNPLGPFDFKGEYIPLFPGSAGTNHGSIIKYKGKWLAFHHASLLSGGNGVCRNLMADWLVHDEAGKLLPITPSVEGVAIGIKPSASRVTLHLEAENGQDALGKLVGTHPEKKLPGYTGTGYCVPFKGAFSGVSFFAQSAMARKVRILVRYRAESDTKCKLLVNYTSYDDPESPEPGRFDKYIHYPRTENGWETKDAGIMMLQAGDNTVRIYGGDGGIYLDHIELQPVE